MPPPPNLNTLFSSQTLGVPKCNIETHYWNTVSTTFSPQMLSWAVRFWITNRPREVSWPLVFLNLAHWISGWFINQNDRTASWQLSALSPQWLLQQLFICIQFIGPPLISPSISLSAQAWSIIWLPVISINKTSPLILICRLTALGHHVVLFWQRFIKGGRIYYPLSG